MASEFETRMSSKGQVVIVKEIREKLGLAENQRFVEKVENRGIVLKPVKRLSALRGVLKGMESKPVREAIKEVKKGWQ